MPSWKLVELERIADFYSGGTPRKSEPQFWAGGTIPWISASSMHTTRVSSSEKMVTPEAIGHGTRIAHRGATLVLVRGMSLLDEIRVSHATRDVAFNQDVKALVAKHGVDPWFLTYALHASRPALLAAVHLAGHGTGVLGTEQLRRLLIPMPSLEEQLRIVGVLGALDDLIEANISTIAAIEGLLQAAFAKYGFDEPGEMELSEIVDTNPKYPKPLGIAPYVDMASLPTDSYQIDEIGARPAAGGARFARGDALLARITPCLENGKAAFVSDTPVGEVHVGSTEFIVLRAKTGIPLSWPYFLSRSARFREFAIRQMSGSTGRQRLDAMVLRKYRLKAPAPEALAQFEASASGLIAAADELKRENAILRSTRDKVLPLLMSGEIRVGDVAKAGARGNNERHSNGS